MPAPAHGNAPPPSTRYAPSRAFLAHTSLRENDEEYSEKPERITKKCDKLAAFFDNAGLVVRLAI
jgi:hypothetical protein